MDAQDRLFGEIAVRLHLLSREQVAACIHAQQSEDPPRRIGELAVELGMISQVDVEVVVEQQRRVLERRRDVRPEPAPAAQQSRYDEIADKPATSAANLKRTLAQPMMSPVAAAAPSPSREVALAPPPSAANAGYAFDAPKPGRAATIVGTGLPDKPRSPSSATIVQPFTAPVRAPSDRIWRNPSRPPNLAPQQPPAAPPPERLDPPAFTPKTGTLAFMPAPVPPPARPQRPVTQPIAHKPMAPPLGDNAYLDRVLKLAVEAGASDLHAHSGAPLLARVDGTLWALTGDAPLPPEAAERVIGEILSDAQWDALMRDGDICFAYEASGLGRFRAHAYRQERGIDITFRVLPRAVPTCGELGLPSRLSKVFDAGPGLYVCSGTAGAGTTTTLASVLAALADEHAWHVVSIEQPIELLYAPSHALIVQRELPTHARDVGTAVEQALRENADLIAIADLLAVGALEAALRAAEAGRRVLASLRAGSCVQAVTRLLQNTPAELHDERRGQLSDQLRVVTNQRLLPQAIGRGRVPALEALVVTPPVAHAIREGKLSQLTAAIASGKATGMLSLDDALDELRAAGIVTAQAAQACAVKKERFSS